MIILGAGLAGCAAALRASQVGGTPLLVEKAVFPRHKVCGEFLSPEVLPLLESLGVAQDFLKLGPARMTRVVLDFDGRQKRFGLPEAALGLSRYRLDDLLFSRCLASGATTVRSTDAPPVIVASGRHRKAEKGHRLFGFKAHFEGPANDAVELYFFNGGYVGVNPVEDGITNVCGLAPESALKRIGFAIDALVESHPPLRQRLAPMARRWEWIFTGPLVFGNELDRTPANYPAGDALSFVDPFTGSGMLAALRTGSLAGEYATMGRSPADYVAAARERLGRPFLVSSVCRKAIWTNWGPRLASLVPGRVLFALTRP